MSVRSSTPSKAGLARPESLISSGGLFSESNGLGVVKGSNGAAAAASFSGSAMSGSAMSRQSSMQSSQSIQRQESSSYSYAESSSTAVEYSRVRLTLADCILELNGMMLTIKAKASGAQFNAITLNLDEHIGIIDGQLVWGYTKFSASCKNIVLREALLVVSYERTSGEWIEITLDLNEHITYSFSRRCFEAILPDPAFMELMSSAAWMNVAVITQPDLRGFLTNPAFQESIQAVARRAVEEVISEMREEMTRAVEKAVSQVSMRAEEHVQHEILSLTKRATLLNTAAYSGLGGLTVMSHEQRSAYNGFAHVLGLGGHGHLASMKGAFSHMGHEAMAMFKGGLAAATGGAVAVSSEEVTVGSEGVRTSSSEHVRSSSSEHVTVTSTEGATTAAVLETRKGTSPVLEHRKSSSRLAK